MSGYVISKHVFGNDELVRNGTRMYYAKLNNNQSLTYYELNPAQYVATKKLLTEVVNKEVVPLTDTSSMVVYKHKYDAQNVKDVNSYILKNNIGKIF